MINFDKLEPGTFVYQSKLSSWNYPIGFSLEIKKYKFIGAMEDDYIFEHTEKTNWPEFYWSKYRNQQELCRLRLTEKDCKELFYDELKDAYTNFFIGQMFPLER